MFTDLFDHEGESEHHQEEKQTLKNKGEQKVENKPEIQMPPIAPVENGIKIKVEKHGRRDIKSDPMELQVDKKESIKKS